MYPSTHLLVLSHFEFVDRQIGTMLSSLEPASARPLARIRRWLFAVA